MPELPELEIVREVLARRLVDQRVDRVTIAPKGGAIVVRDLTRGGLSRSLVGETIRSADRRGKFILLAFSPSALLLVINPKLTGRFQLCAPGAPKAGPVHLALHFSEPPLELRYVDKKTMGQVYLTLDALAVPTFADMGPEPLGVSLEEFRARLSACRGEIKGILTRAEFLAGIGNAYADEILWQARLHPYRKRPALSEEEVERLYHSTRETLTASIEKVRAAMGEDIHLKPRDFFAVHMRGGEACPRCGTPISAITANQRITNFCRTCQPGGLIRGM